MRISGGRPAPGTGPDHESRPTLTLEERRDIFRRMVRDEIGVSPLTYSRRRLLIRYAGQIGIDDFEANLLIAQAQHEAGQLDLSSVGHYPDDEVPFDTPVDLELLLHPERWPVWFRLSLALLAAIIIDLLVIRAFF